MRALFAALCAAVLAGCGPASRLSYSERAFIHCSETRRDVGSCMQPVMDAWSRLAGACGVRNNVLQVCAAEFERLYYCNVSTREEKTTDKDGTVTTRSTETRSGPGCGMDPSRRFSLEAAYREECERRSFVPETWSVEGAACICGHDDCTFAYPDVSDETAVHYFPEKAGK